MTYGIVGFRATPLTVPLQNNMYQPLEQRMAVAREQQRDMEQAFERLFVSTHGQLKYYVLRVPVSFPTPFQG